MGIEAFGVSMQIVELGVFQEIKSILTGYPYIRMGSVEITPDYETILGEYSDSTHFIDLQLSREITSDICTVAVRFSLCSYESIDSIFIDLVNNILSSFEADVWLMTSAIRRKDNFLPGDSKSLIVALPNEIREMRKYWQNRFGTKQGTVRSDDSFSFVGAMSKDVVQPS